ncbi:MAG: response regulator, partial [Myxococcales bacterium]
DARPLEVRWSRMNCSMTSFKASDSVTERVRVLVVEDFTDAREMYVEYLTMKGYDVIGAEDGLAALEVARALIPDVIVLDIGLPKLSGFAVLRKLKAGVDTRGIDVITLSASAGTAYRDEAMEAGAAMALEKPCTPDELHEAISAFTNGAEQTG